MVVLQGFQCKFPKTPKVPENPVKPLGPNCLFSDQGNSGGTTLPVHIHDTNRVDSVGKSGGVVLLSVC